MIEVYQNVFMGKDADAQRLLKDYDESEWYLLHVAKEKWHRGFVGYIGRGAPKDSPEYLVARRGNRMALNMVDAKLPEFFSKEMIMEGLDFLEEGFNAGKKLLINCNEGKSRSCCMAMLFVAKRILKAEHSLEDMEAVIKKLHPDYSPGEGIRGHLKQCWDEY